MANRPKDKGTMAESGFAGYLQANGFPYAERRALAGATDKGDITGTPGLVWEVKYANGGLRMAEWLQETVVERENAGAKHGILVIKPAGLGLQRVGEWYAAMVAWDYDQLVSSLHTGFAVESMEMPYQESNVAIGLSALELQTRSLGAFPLLVLRPRGQREHPENWYRVSTVKHMVRLVRRAGYGEPPTEGGH